MKPKGHCGTSEPCRAKGTMVTRHCGAQWNQCSVVKLWSLMESVVWFNAAGSYGIMETIVTLQVMPWRGYLEQRLDKVKRIKWVYYY